MVSLRDLPTHERELTDWGYKYLLDNCFLMVNVDTAKKRVLEAIAEMIHDDPQLLDTISDADRHLAQCFEIKKILKDIDTYLELSADIRQRAEAARLIKIEINLLRRIRNNMSRVNLEKEDQETCHNHNLIYLMTDSDNSYFEKDLKKIAQEYYADIAGMLEHLRNGELALETEHGKKMSSGSTLKGCYELKYHKFRIMYYILPNCNLLVVMVKHKKRDGLKDLNLRITNQEDAIQELIDIYHHNPEKAAVITSEHQAVDGRIINHLKDRSRVRRR